MVKSEVSEAGEGQTIKALIEGVGRSGFYFTCNVKHWKILNTETICSYFLSRDYGSRVKIEATYWRLLVDLGW